MIRRVEISSAAAKDLKKVPARIVEKLAIWIGMVEESGLETVRMIPGFHDEPLKGRRKGQRSIRLSCHYRAIYVLMSDNSIRFVLIEEVTKHEY